MKMRDAIEFKVDMLAVALRISTKDARKILKHILTTSICNDDMIVHGEYFLEDGRIKQICSICKLKKVNKWGDDVCQECADTHIGQMEEYERQEETNDI